MSQRVLFNGAVLVRPGASTKIDASQFQNVTLSGLGIVGLVGEADGGEPRTVQVFNSPAAVKSFYGSGNLVEAANIAASPGNDPRIPAGAQTIVTYKVNLSTKSQYAHPTVTPIHTFLSLQYGTEMNQITVALAVGTTANERIITITDLDDFGGLVTEVSPSLGGTGKFTIQYTGAATVALLTVTGTSITVVTSAPAVPADDLTIAFDNFASLNDIINFINNNPSYSCASLITNAVSFDPRNLDAVVVANITALTSVFSRNFDLADWVNNNSSIISDTLTQGLAGPAAVLAQTSLAGGARGTSNNTAWIDGFNALRNIRVNQLVPLASENAPQGPSGTGDSFAFALGVVTLTDAAALFTPAHVGLAITIVGATSPGNNGTFIIASYISPTQITYANAGGVTEAYAGAWSIAGPLGTYTYASILAALTAHCKFVSSTQGRNECQGWSGMDGTKAELISAANLQNSEHLCLFGQKTLLQRTFDGEIVTFPEWATAVGAAGMRGGAPLGEPLTWKYIQSFGVTSDPSWSETNNDDVVALELNGVTVVNNIIGKGFRIDKMITTFTKMDNDAYTEETVVQIWKAVAYDLRSTLEDVYVGRPGSIQTVQTVPAVVSRVCELFRQAGSITDSLINGVVIKAYRNITVSLNGDVLNVGVTISPTPGINFVLTTIVLVPAQISL